MTEKQETEKRLLELLTVRVELPRLTGVGSELLSLMHLPADQIEMHRVVSLVESDPSLTVEVLRTANSIYFGALREVKTVSQAITRMGFDNTIHILSYHCLSGLMPVSKSLPSFSAKQFWLHSLATATVARMLGKPQYLLHSLPGELYTAGLLHDIGKIVLASYAAKEFNQACTMAREEGMPLHQAEMRVMGLDHARVGCQVLDAWNLPIPILNAVRGHHEQMEDGEKAQEGGEIVNLIEMADAIAYHSGFADGTGQPPHDLMKTAIIRDGQSSIAEPKTLQRLLDDAKAVLADKAKLYRKSEDKPLQAKPEASSVRRMRQPRPVQSPGLFEWLTGWVRRIFSAT